MFSVITRIFMGRVLPFCRDAADLDMWDGRLQFYRVLLPGFVQNHPSSSFSMLFTRVQVVQPYSSTCVYAQSGSHQKNMMVQESCDACAMSLFGALFFPFLVQEAKTRRCHNREAGDMVTWGCRSRWTENYIFLLLHWFSRE